MTPRGGPRTVSADDAVRRGRLAKAEQFLRAADDLHQLDDAGEAADAEVTLHVHAGIAAAAAALRALLGMKTRAGNGHDPISPERAARARQAAHALVDRAR